MMPTSTRTNTMPAMANTGMIRSWICWDFSPRGLSVVSGRPSGRPMFRTINQPATRTMTRVIRVMTSALRLFRTSTLSVADGRTVEADGPARAAVIRPDHDCGHSLFRTVFLAVVLPLGRAGDAADDAAADEQDTEDQQGAHE